MYNLEEWLARETATGQMPGGVIQPEGMGLNALCKKCNVDLLGVHYVPAFVDFVQAGKEMLGSIAPALGELDARNRATAMDVGFLAADRLAVAKQIVSMLLVTSGRDVVVKNPALAQFVLNPSARGLPPNYRLFIALTPGPVARTTGVSGILNTETGTQVVVAEIVYPPFAYALCFNGEEVYPEGEITHWTQAEYGVVVEERLRLVLGFCHTVFPADLRTSAQVQAETETD